MRFFALLVGMVLLLPGAVRAQVTINPAALRQLAGITPPPIPVVAAPARPVVVHRIRHRHLAIMMILPPRPAPMVAKPLPPKPVPVVARVPPPVVLAPVTLTFADGSATLPLSAASALKPYCKSGGILAINARAAGDPSDPSVAMRLSLARAMALRDALVRCGVPSADIIPRALGEVPGVNNDETQLGPAP